MTPAVAPPFPWDAATAFCLGTLRLAPGDFWRLSLVELALLLPTSEGAPSRDRLAALMAAFPDG